MLTFLLHLKFYQNFKNHHAGKLNLFGELCFA